MNKDPLICFKQQVVDFSVCPKLCIINYAKNFNSDMTLNGQAVTGPKVWPTDFKRTAPQRKISSNKVNLLTLS